MGAQTGRCAARNARTLLASTIVFLNVGAIQYSNNTVQLPLACCRSSSFIRR